MSQDPLPLCRLCGAPALTEVTQEGPWHVLECRTCGFVFMVPLPDEAYLKNHYQQYLPADAVRIRQWRRLMVEISRRSLEAMDQRVPGVPGRRLLDVGCGYGFFLEKAREQGWDVQGVEPCAHAREYALKHGLEVDAGVLMEQHYLDAAFDAVTLFYVLEHVREPLVYLKEAYRILKPGGVLLVRVPHTTPIVKGLKLLRINNRLYDAPSHLNDFSPATLSLALSKAGFKDATTFPGGATRPHSWDERVVSVMSGGLADVLYGLSFGKWLLPGVSKTTITIKT